MKKAAKYIVIIFLCFVAIFSGMTIYEKHFKKDTDNEDKTEDTEQLIKSRDWDANDSYILAKLVENVAAGESMETKMLIALVALNRTWSNYFPNTVEDVIGEMEASNQWFFIFEPKESSYEAIRKIQYDGWNESENALYFIRNSSQEKEFYDSNFNKLYCCGNFTFYERK